MLGSVLSKIKTRQIQKMENFIKDNIGLPAVVSETMFWYQVYGIRVILAFGSLVHW